jgi:outer membrane protein assembly factor BamB
VLRRISLLLLYAACLGAGGCYDVSGPHDARVAWFHADPTGSASEPYADSSLVVFTSFNDMRVIALNAHTGSVQWQTRLPLVPGTPYAGMPVQANVGTYGDLIIVPAWDVYALDRATGSVRWSFTEADDYPGYGYIFLSDGVVYSVGRYLYAIDAATGALRYRVDLGEQPFRPVVVDTVVYVATRREIVPGALGNGHVLALNAHSAATIWSVPIDDPQDSARGGSVGPVFITDSMAIVAGFNEVVYSLSKATGQTFWTYHGAGVYSAGLAVVDHTVIVAGDGGSVEGIDLMTGHGLWRTGPGSSVLERITLGPSLALVSVGALFAFDAGGHIRWQDGGAGWGGPVYSTAATYRNGMVYIGSVSPDADGAGFYALRVP